MQKLNLTHWRFWTFWVCVNAIASFGWGIALGHGTAYVLGMVVGIAIFIVAYALLDAYLLKNGLKKWHDALKLGVYIKAGLQLLNLGIFIDLMISPEIWAGILALMVVGDGFDIGFGIDSDTYPFWFALASTLMTGAILSLIVGVLTQLIKLFKNKNLTAQQD